MDSQAAPVQNTTKSIVVTGDAAKVGGARRRGGRRTVKKSPQEGGSAPTPTPTPTPQPMNVIKQLTQQPGSAATAPLTGGAIKQKVSLVPAKTRNKTRVLLAPKQAVQTAHTSQSKTKKQKKLSLRVANIRRKVASTRKHIHASTALPIDKIRKELVDAKLLNPASKAPEALIRKIYADFKITTNKA